jgi:hypothetical protein
MTKVLPILAINDDHFCLMEHRDHPAAPTMAYGFEVPNEIGMPRSAIHRRYALSPAYALIGPEGYEVLVADLARHEEAQLLMLAPGEFIGLLIAAWRHDHHIIDYGCRPMPYWSVLDLFALYKRTRAVNAKRRDDAKRIEGARLAFKDKYEPHRELFRRQYRRDTVH